jgi:uncharacterized membrane protein
MPTTLLNVAAKSAAGPDSTVARALDYAPAAPTNVGETERLVSGLVGGALCTLGFTGRGPGLLSAIVGGSLLYRAITGNCMGYRMLGVNTAGGEGPATAIPAGAGVKVEESVTINRPAAELYRAWRRFDQLPRFMDHLREVKDLGNGKSHWVARGPAGTSVEWDAQIVTEREGEVIAWKSLDGSDVDTAGSVHFRPAPGGRGTVVTVTLKYLPPAGKVGAAVARLFGEAPEQQVRADLQRFKSQMEAGGAGTATGQPGGL